MTKLAQFTTLAGKRIWKATQAIESQNLGALDAGFIDSYSYRIAYTAGGATARVGTLVGTGTAVLYYVDDTGNLQSDGTEIDYINLATAAVGSAKYIGVIPIGNRWKVIWEECG